MRRLAKALQYVGTFVLVAVIVLAGLMIAGPRFGWETHPVLSGSMEPTLRVGGLIVTTPVRLEDVKIGDIATFQSGGIRVTHRVVDIVEEEGKPWFQTKGDANEEPDPNFFSSKGEEIAKVAFHLPYLGYLASFMQSKGAFLVLVGVPALVLVGLFGRDILRGIREEMDKKKAKAASAPAEGTDDGES